jgi:hypothetical protein
MITIQLQCDCCKTIKEWRESKSQEDISLWALDNGWEFGKEHICPDCLSNLENNRCKQRHDRIMEIYNKYHAVVHSRLKTKTKRITKTQLDTWTKKVRIARTLVEMNRYSIEEFIKYLEGNESAITKEFGELTLVCLNDIEYRRKIKKNKQSCDRANKIYTTHYSRQYARLKAKTIRITRNQFDSWVTKARYALTLLQLGVYTFDDFIKYLDGKDSEITKDLGELIKWD